MNLSKRFHENDLLAEKHLRSIPEFYVVLAGYGMAIESLFDGTTKTRSINLMVYWDTIDNYKCP